MATTRHDRGLAAVEFALITPLLLGITLGAVEYGARYSEAAQYNNAALIAARKVAIANDQTAGTNAAMAAGANTGSTVTYTFTRGSCAVQSDGTYGDVTVVVSKTGMAPITPIPNLIPGVAKTWGVSGKAVFRCGG